MHPPRPAPGQGLASYRRTRALELRAEGKGYAEIAREVGYANKGTAHKVVSQALEAREARDVDFLRQISLARLEALYAALWPAAKAGDVPTVLAVLRINDTLCRLLGLFEPRHRKKSPKDKWDNCYGPPTVVINPKDCRHDGCAIHGRFDGRVA